MLLAGARAGPSAARSVAVRARLKSAARRAAARLPSPAPVARCRRRASAVLRERRGRYLRRATPERPRAAAPVAVAIRAAPVRRAPEAMPRAPEARRAERAAAAALRPRP